MKKALGLSIGAVLVLAGCTTGETDPATDITATSATLMGKGSCEADDSGEWWFQYRQGTSGAWLGRSHHDYGAGTAYPCPASSTTVSDTLPAGTLKPGTQYQFRVCATHDIYWEGPSCQDSDDTITNEPPNYDGFTTGDGYPSITDADASDNTGRDGDFDTAGQLLGGDGGWQNIYFSTSHPGTGDGLDGSGAIDTTRYLEGTRAARISATAAVGTQHRAEVGWNNINGAPVTYEEAFYIPSGTPVLGYINQHKQSGGLPDDCANGGISNRTGSTLEYRYRGLCSEATESALFEDPFPRNQWFVIRVYFKIGEPGTGEIQAWMDPDATGPAVYDEQVPLQTQDTRTEDNNQFRVRQGSYGDGGPFTIWIDGHRLDCHTTC
jgi:hypothetical protein